MDRDKTKNQENLAMGVSVLIALAVVSAFCMLCILVVENLEILSQHSQNKHVILNSVKDLSDFVI